MTENETQIRDMPAERAAADRAKTPPASSGTTRRSPVGARLSERLCRECTLEARHRGLVVTDAR